MWKRIAAPSAAVVCSQIRHVGTNCPNYTSYLSRLSLLREPSPIRALQVSSNKIKIKIINFFFFFFSTCSACCTLHTLHMIYFRNAMQSIPVDNRHCTKKPSMLKMHSSFLSSLLFFFSSSLLSFLSSRWWHCQGWSRSEVECLTLAPFQSKDWRLNLKEALHLTSLLRRQPQHCKSFFLSTGTGFGRVLFSLYILFCVCVFLLFSQEISNCYSASCCMLPQTIFSNWRIATTGQIDARVSSAGARSATSGQ